jgi:hypothetical protein
MPSTHISTSLRQVPGASRSPPENQFCQAYPCACARATFSFVVMSIVALPSRYLIGSWKATTPSPGEPLPPLSIQAAAPADAGRDVDARQQLVEPVDRGLLERDQDQVPALGVLQQTSEHVRVLDVLGIGLGGRAALDFEIDRDLRERAQHLVEGGDAEIGGPVALRRLLPASSDAAEAVRLAGELVAVVVAGLRGEPVGRIEPLDLPQGERGLP